MTKQPFLTDFPLTVFATAKRRLQAAIRQSSAIITRRSLSGYAVLFEDVLPGDFLNSIDPTLRQRSFGQAHDKPLDEDSAKKAVELMRWFSDRQLILLDAGRRGVLEKRLSELMTLLVFGDKTIRDLKRSHGFKKGEVERINATFPNWFFIQKAVPPGGGRPSPVAIMNRSPEVLKAVAHLMR